MRTSPRIAIIGSGISGLAAAHTLRDHAQITLFEAASWFGGHTHTVDITLPTPAGPITHGVDTGFLVYNEKTYPNLINLFAQLGVDTAPSDMSFSVQVPDIGLEWSGSDLGTVFAQRSNLINSRFWRMLTDLLRFNATCTRLAREGRDRHMTQPLGDFLREQGYSDAFRDWYFLPMLGCIWSCPTDQMLQFPVATMIRFCHNHGLLQISGRPQWRTVRDGARSYVEGILQGIPDKRLNTPVQSVTRDGTGVDIVAAGRVERFDEVIFATHSDQALGLLHEPSMAERELLGAIRYQPNRAVLHTDTSVLPRNPKAWAAWNYERAQDSESESARVCLHYLINRLQPVPFEQAVVVSLNPVRAIDPGRILGEFEYAHPVFDSAAIRAQERLHEIQGRGHTWFCGAWTGYGFHEDGLKSGLSVARSLLPQIARAAA